MSSSFKRHKGLSQRTSPSRTVGEKSHFCLRPDPVPRPNEKRLYAEEQPDHGKSTHSVDGRAFCGRPNLVEAEALRDITQARPTAASAASAASAAQDRRDR